MPYLFTLILIFSFPSMTHADISEGLVGWWTFNDGSGTSAADSSGQGHTGTLTNGPVWTGGKRDGGLSFDGINDYVDLNNNITADASDFSYAVWVKSAAGSGAIMGRGQDGSGSGWSVAVDDNGTGYGFNIVRTVPSIVQVPGAGGGITVVLGQWQHIVVIYRQGVSITMYVNGGFDSTISDAGSVLRSSSVGVRIGGNAGGSNAYFSGVIDDVRIYNRALTETEIKTIYMSGTPRIVVNGNAKINGLKMK